MSETLIKLEYTNLQQFINDANHNFAVIANSPLYKGIPGKQAESIQGLRGYRGSQFIFINYGNFNTQYPNELSNASKITLAYINDKLLNFSEKTKLLLSLGVEELVQNDIIILTNSMMLSYDIVNDKFVDTKLAFNESINLASSIETKVEDYVKEYVDNNPTINSLKNIFADFQTYAKLTPDTNGDNIITELIGTEVYVPYIPGLTSSGNGMLINNHKYFGFNDTLFPKTNNGTFVFGSIKKYIELLTNTFDVTTPDTYNSDFAPGINNIPAFVILQDTNNAGVMIGKKNNANLKAFAHIYKDVNDNLVIKSDSGPDSETGASPYYSQLIIGKTKMTYDKLVEFQNNLDIVKDLTVIGNINTKYLKYNEYTTAKTANTVEFGLDSGSTLINLFDVIKYSKFVGNVLITDSTGKLVNNYSLETGVLNDAEKVTFTPITKNTTSDKKVVTSNYLGFLVDKINNVTSTLKDNYYDKAFLNDSTKTLTLTNSIVLSKYPKANGIVGINDVGVLNVTKSFGNPSVLETAGFDDAGQQLTGDFSNPDIVVTLPYLSYFQDKLNYHSLVLMDECWTLNQLKDSTKTLEISNILKTTGLKNSVLVTDTDGIIGNLYSVESQLVVDNEKNTFTPITKNLTSNKKFVTSNYIGFLIDKINNVTSTLNTNYYDKTYLGDSTKTLTIKNKILFYNDETIIGRHDSYVELIDGVSTPIDALKISYSDGWFTKLNGQLQLKSYGKLGGILNVDGNGNVLNDYTIENAVITGESTQLTFGNPIELLLSGTTKLPSSRYLGFVISKINNIQSYIVDNFETKDKYYTKTVLDDNSVEKELKGFLSFSGTTKFKKLLNADAVPVADANQIIQPGFNLATEADHIDMDSHWVGDVVNDKFALVPISTTDTTDGSYAVGMNSAGVQTGTFGPSTKYKILTGLHWSWLVKSINNIKTRLRNTYSKDESYSKNETNSKLNNCVQLLANLKVTAVNGGQYITQTGTYGDPEMLITDGTFIQTGVRAFVLKMPTSDNPISHLLNYKDVIIIPKFYNHNTYAVTIGPGAKTDIIIESSPSDVSKIYVKTTVDGVLLDIDFDLAILSKPY